MFRSEYLLNTITIKFLKPRKLGISAESWLKHEALFFECTAATCRSTGGVDGLTPDDGACPLVLLEVSGMASLFISDGREAWSTVLGELNVVVTAAIAKNIGGG